MAILTFLFRKSNAAGAFVQAGVGFLLLKDSYQMMVKQPKSSCTVFGNGNTMCLSGFVLLAHKEIHKNKR